MTDNVIQFYDVDISLARDGVNIQDIEGLIPMNILNGADEIETNSMNLVQKRRRRSIDPTINENQENQTSFGLGLPATCSTSCEEQNMDIAISNMTGLENAILPSKDGSILLHSHASHISGQLYPPLEADVLPSVPPCQYCQTKFFCLEPKGFCCSGGEVLLAPSSSPPLLWELFTSQSLDSKQFQMYVRSYNNAFAFTSFGVKYDKELCKRNKGIYTFRAQGQVYHYINGLIPCNEKPSYLQLYFYDTNHEIDNRLNMSDRLDPKILASLIDILTANPYSTFFRGLRYLPSLEDRAIVIRNHANLDQRVFNAPSASQVAAIWIESDDTGCGSRDIIVYGKAGYTYKVQYYFGCYDPLQYPLLFPLGETGWHQGIERIKKHEKRGLEVCASMLNVNNHNSVDELLRHESQVMKEGKKKQNVVSCREYYCYKLQIRPTDRSILLHSGRLLQQFVVDMYIKLESSRLDYFRNSQKEIRAELYQGILDSISIGENRGSRIGKRVILPASFIGGPRDMRKRYVDAMALVQRYGKPDLFLTMTCNPSWPEIKNELLPGEEAQNRPDLVARVFRAKLEQIKIELFKKKIFGPVSAYVYTIEFQKRGLPHAHFLIILQEGSKIKTADLYDLYVCAELPNPAVNPHLFQAVRKHMMHGPCGQLNPTNVCMKKNGMCKNHYPKQFCNRTSQGEDSYPIYQRQDNGRNVNVRGHTLDNRWVIPYNPYLLAKFDCHINVEICSTIKAVKYLYKYIFKGHDRVSFHLVDNNSAHVFDEIDMFQTARWVSPPEAMWRIYGFTLNEISPPVVSLQLHLEDQQSVTFLESANLQSVVKYTPSLKTMLTEYFFMNKNNSDARNYLYKEFPEHFVWSQQDKIWSPRKKRFAIGRIVTASPVEGERYYLRLLLNHVRGAISFHDLKIVGGVTTNSFREAALLRGLLEADNSVELCMLEATSYQMPSALRRLFVTILVYCNPINARSLWEKFQSHMCEDYLRLPRMTIQGALNKALQDISYQLESMGKKLEDYNLMDGEFKVRESQKGFKEIEEELNLPISQEDLASIHSLNEDKKRAYNIILERVLYNQPGAFFVDGPGGTGKTYLYKALLAFLRSRGFIALATASSGIAASILPGGRTAHSRFKIPLNPSRNSICSVGKQTGLAQLLNAAKLIIWDEAPMVNKHAIEAFDRMLQDICNSTVIFGGKVVVFGGDFRQILPVVPKATVQQIIDSTLVTSPLWHSLEKLKLTENMRSKFDKQFCDFLMKVGDGSEKYVVDDEIEIPSSMVVPYVDDQSLHSLLKETFPHIRSYPNNIESMINRAILTPKNDLVDTINEILINELPGDPIEYKSFDTPIDSAQEGLQEDFFNILTPSGFPPHILHLKHGCPVILLRNIDPSKGMCNGTRLICKSFEPNVIHAEIAVGHHKGKQILLPRIPLLPPENESTIFPFQRKQFPIRLSFAMTINKAQGQTLDFVGIYLPQPVFSHGQLYVALSRAKTSSSVKILVAPSLNQVDDKVCTRNVVHEEVLVLAAES